MNSRKIVLWQLFFSTLYLSAFTFGGGYFANTPEKVGNLRKQTQSQMQAVYIV